MMTKKCLECQGNLIQREHFPVIDGFLCKECYEDMLSCPIGSVLTNIKGEKYDFSKDSFGGHIIYVHKNPFAKNIEVFWNHVDEFTGNYECRLRDVGYSSVMGGTLVSYTPSDVQELWPKFIDFIRRTDARFFLVMLNTSNEFIQTYDLFVEDMFCEQFLVEMSIR